jgi:hypothetical protein
MAILTDNSGNALTDNSGNALVDDVPVPPPTTNFMYVVFNTCVALVAAVAVMAMPW